MKFKSQTAIDNETTMDIVEVQMKGMQIFKKAFLVLKYPTSLGLKKNLVEKADYLIDKIKVIINAKGEILLLTTPHTVMIEYKRQNQNEEDT